MPVTLDEMMQGFSAEDREEIREDAARMAAESQTLRQLRAALGLTQDQVADALETSQSNLAQIEKKTDVKVSTVAKVVEALGGQLHLVAVLPGREPVTLKFGEDGVTSRQARPTGAREFRLGGEARFLSPEPVETAEDLRPSRRVARQSTRYKVAREMEAAVAEQKAPRVIAGRASPGAPKGSKDRPKSPKSRT